MNTLSSNSPLGSGDTATMFILQFPITDLAYWAERYNYPGEEAIAQITSPRIRSQGYCTEVEFMALCEWKSPRIRPRCASNEPEFIKIITEMALSTFNERLRIEILTLLSGVSWSMASVILHWGHHEPYPILDFRALWSLGSPRPPVYNFVFWQKYTQACRELAHQAGVSMRTLDRALWQYSKENQ